MSERQAFTLRLPMEDYRALRHYCYFVGITMQEAVHRAVRAYLAAQGEEQRIDALFEETLVRFKETAERLRNLPD